MKSITAERTILSVRPRALTPASHAARQLRAIATFLLVFNLHCARAASDALPREEAIRHVLAFIQRYAGDWEAPLPKGMTLYWVADEVPAEHRTNFLRARESCAKAGQNFLLRLEEGKSTFMGMEFGRLPEVYPISMREKHFSREKVANLTPEDWIDLSMKYAIGSAKHYLWEIERRKGRATN